jgi:hypothetical protein
LKIDEYFILPWWSSSINSSRLTPSVAAHAERLDGAVEIEPMPRLVLHLGEQDRLALQRRRPRDPVALGKLADDLGMRVLADLADQRLAIALGHPLLGLDLLAPVDALLEGALLGRHLLGLLQAVGLDQLGVHGLPPQTRSMMAAMPWPTPMHIVQSA